MIKGKIIKGIAGFYYVESGGKVYESRAKGLFRKKEISPIVGDIVKIRLSEEDGKGYIEEIEKRSNELERPNVSNIDQIMLVFSLKSPNINLWLLDKFIALSEKQNIEIIICFSKKDLSDEKESQEISNTYRKIGYKTYEVSSFNDEDMEKLKKELKGKTTALAGPSGVGKSTILNSIQKDLDLETGNISKKTERGKHTTRHVELFKLDTGGYVLDTPGFSSLDLDFLNVDNLDHFFVEIYKQSEWCRFRGCRHYKEIGCNVKKELEIGNIAESRYKNYISLLEEIMERRDY